MGGGGKTLVWQEGSDLGAVAVFLEWAEARQEPGSEIPVEYRIVGWIPGTSKRPYEATIPACSRDECRLGQVKPCSRKITDNGRHSGQKVADWWTHHRVSCHGWHDGTVIALAEQVLSTYGSFTPINALAG